MLPLTTASTISAFFFLNGGFESSHSNLLTQFPFKWKLSADLLLSLHCADGVCKHSHSQFIGANIGTTVKLDLFRPRSCVFAVKSH